MLHFLARIVDAASGAVPGGWWALVALAALVVVVTAGVLNWIGPLARAHRGSGPLAAEGGARTAAITGRRRSGSRAPATTPPRPSSAYGRSRPSSRSGACSRRA